MPQAHTTNFSLIESFYLYPKNQIFKSRIVNKSMGIDVALCRHCLGIEKNRKLFVSAFGNNFAGKLMHF
ncbi:hypothetical protein A6S26_11505 [Nostoc sp. ATCC 43529]|nr:hypothetical protein A6S26_11505 [Nostoc sp. ATCC 43529]